MTANNNRLNRRTFLTAGGAIGVAVVAGCIEEEGGAQDGSNENGNGNQNTQNEDKIGSDNEDWGNSSTDSLKYDPSIDPEIPPSALGQYWVEYSAGDLSEDSPLKFFATDDGSYGYGVDVIFASSVDEAEIALTTGRAQDYPIEEVYVAGTQEAVWGEDNISGRLYARDANALFDAVGVEIGYDGYYGSKEVAVRGTENVVDYIHMEYSRGKP